MATFVMLGKYSGDGLAGISTQRTEQAAALVADCGGTVKVMLAMLGCYDLICVADFPGVEEAMGCSVALSRLTGISFATYPAVGVEEFDRIAAQA
jgi:uncharacterized protein with GYD domain